MQVDTQGGPRHHCRGSFVFSMRRTYVLGLTLASRVGWTRAITPPHGEVEAGRGYSDLPLFRNGYSRGYSEIVVTSQNRCYFK